MTVDLRLGDCLEIMPTLAANSVDLIAVDPPYYKVKGEAWDRQWDTPAAFLEWLDRCAAEWQRLLKPNGSLYVFASPRMSARVECKIAERFNVLNRITWRKPPYATKAEMFDKDTCRKFLTPSESIIFAEHYGADNIAKGEAGYVAKCDDLRGFIFEPLRKYLDDERKRAGVSKSAANRIFEPSPNVCQYWWQQRNWQLPTKENYEKLRVGLSRLNHGGEYLRREYEDLRREYEDLRREYEDLRREYEDLRRPFQVTAEVPYTDVWDFPTVAHYAGKHPCEKPLAMMEHIIRTSSREGATVLDCFMGSGVTGEAARKLGRSFIGIELHEPYFMQAERRIQEAQAQLTMQLEAV